MLEYSTNYINASGSILGNTTSTLILPSNNNPIITISSEFKETSNGNLLIIVKRQAQVQIGSIYPLADKVWKEIYGVSDGNLKLINTVYGKVIPAHSVSEVIEFDE